MDELCYQYRYDYRNRPYAKKVPGKGWEYTIYNKLDQIILTQDANQRANNEWLYTKYDAIGRIAYTGKITDSRDRTTIQDEANAYTNKLWVERGNAVMIGGITMYYNDGGYPKVLSGETLTINYYDDYGFLANESTVFNNPNTVYNQNVSDLTKSLMTGSKVKILGSSYWKTTASYYDKKARAIYVVSHNAYLETTDIVENKLDFVGKTEETTVRHRKGSNAEIVTIDRFEYDHMGRTMKQTQTIGNQEETIAENTYDELGQIISKTTGGGLQTIDYTYNIRGWMTKINDPSNLGSDIFAYGIGYDESTYGGDVLYNGNIAETYWKTANDNSLRWHTYSYDALSRVKSSVSNDGRYNLSGVSYDRNGNLLSLVRKGAIVANADYTKASHFGVMDNLSYTYYANSNKLRTITDQVTSQFGFSKSSTSAGTEYLYDANGNMTRDPNKGITSILWNHGNFPTEVKFNNSNTQKINYIYTANGEKVRKVVNNGGNITTTDYAGAYQYVNGTLKYIRNFEDGYVYPEAGGYKYTYQFTDQLGNIRLAYSDKDGDGKVDIVRGTTDIDGDGDNHHEIVQANDYYPFGLQIQYGTNHPNALINGIEDHYKYQNQELQNELGLGWYQFKYRMHDPELGRFISIDPLAEKYIHNSTFAFAENKVIKFNELEGLEITLNKFDRISYDNKTWAGKAASFVGNVGIGIVNGGIDVFNYAGDLDRADQAAGGFGKGAGTKVVDDAVQVKDAVVDYASNTTLEEFGDDVTTVLSDVETYENLAGAFVSGAGVTKLGKLGTISKSTNAVSKTAKSVALQATPGKTTTILGRLTDTRALGDALDNVKSGMNDGGFNILKQPDEYWSMGTNMKWLQRSIDRGDIIKAASDPTDLKNIYRNGVDGKKTVYGQEVDYLTSQGYKYDASTQSFIQQ